MSASELVDGKGRPSSPEDARRRWLVAAKLAVTLALLGFLLARVDLGDLGRALRHSLNGWLGLALGTNSLLLASSTWKWKRLLHAVGLRPAYSVLLRLYTIGFFFSSFLPGTVGGDVVRWHAASPSPELRLRVAATILAERITGVVALVALCGALLAWDHERLATAPTLLVLGSVGIALVAGLLLAWNARFAALLTWGARSRVGWLVRPLHKLHRALTAVPSRVLVAAVLYSVPFYASSALCFFLISQAAGAEIGFVEAATVQLLVCLLTLIPISLGGLGLAQAGDVYVLGLMGVDAPTALGMSLLRRAIAWVYAAIGGLLFLRRARLPSIAEVHTRSDETPQLPAGADAEVP